MRGMLVNTKGLSMHNAIVATEQPRQHAHELRAVGGRLLELIPDSDRLYMLKSGRDLPPVDVDRARKRLTEQNFALAAEAKLRDDGTLWIDFERDIGGESEILYAWVVDDTIVRVGSSYGVFRKRFFTSGYVMSGPERFVTSAI